MIGFASESFDCVIYPDQVAFDVRFFVVKAHAIAIDRLIYFAICVGIYMIRNE